MNIVEVKSAATYQSALITLLQDCVDSGASVGFLPPLTTEESTRYWQGVDADLAAGHRKLWLALEHRWSPPFAKRNMLWWLYSGHRLQP
ncbi:hypothetical protein ACE1BN_21405 [Aeromonas veronii]|uniref:hypothetical protein n=1 Tax=Aeromonas veronii TaxID=654 RepID=UPI0035B7EBE8